jgi:NAD(P)-dependent dehydrogenase (short-subunit alcohol dehydrogenase family)
LSEGLPLAGRRILVIGGETPLGRAIAVGLAERGADVAIASLTSDTKAEFAINSALNELWAMGRKGLALPVDASDEGPLKETFAFAESELGPIHLTVTVTTQRVALAALDAQRTFVVPEGSAADEAIALVAERLG